MLYMLHTCGRSIAEAGSYNAESLSIGSGSSEEPGNRNVKRLNADADVFRDDDMLFPPARAA